jgi:hypothetical protein
MAPGFGVKAGFALADDPAAKTWLLSLEPFRPCDDELIAANAVIGAPIPRRQRRSFPDPPGPPSPPGGSSFFAHRRD